MIFLVGVMTIYMLVQSIVQKILFYNKNHITFGCTVSIAKMYHIVFNNKDHRCDPRYSCSSINMKSPDPFGEINVFQVLIMAVWFGIAFTNIEWLKILLSGIGEISNSVVYFFSS